MSESRNTIKRILPGILVSIVLIAVILYFVDIKTTLTAMRNANYGLIAIAASLSFVWLAVRAIVWRTLLRNKPTYKDVFYTAGEGYLLNNFLPFRLGEIGRAFLLSRKSGGLTFAEIIPTIVIERVVDLIISAVIFLGALPYVVNSESSPTLGYVIGGLTESAATGVNDDGRVVGWYKSSSNPDSFVVEGLSGWNPASAAADGRTQAGRQSQATTAAQGQALLRQTTRTMPPRETPDTQSTAHKRVRSQLPSRPPRSASPAT
ncbi:MAG: hypothetical protein EDM79_05655 [Chloroflexi bacterium]|nr:MAG: hypothetical protein EDM79_05655 [Chloroflexota bacterium]